MEKILIKVNNSDNSRIDKFIVENTNLSRTKVKSLFENDLIFLNNELVKKLSITINNGDVIHILNNEKKSENINNDYINSLQSVNLPIDIVYEDNEIMIVNKPSGLLVYPTNHKESDSLAHRLMYYFQSKKIFVDAADYRYGIVHRLDKDTSGLLLIAKNSQIYNNLQTMMQNNQVKRKYIAIVNNCFGSKDQLFKINVPIGRVHGNELRMRANSTKDTKNATTIVSVLKNISNSYALVECELLTGRTHQVRVHMQYINHHVVNDPLYGVEKKCSSYHQYLYCSNISFYHPTTQNLINIQLPLPDEFIDFIHQKGENYE